MLGSIGAVKNFGGYGLSRFMIERINDTYVLDSSGVLRDNRPSPNQTVARSRTLPLLLLVTWCS